MLRSGRSGTLLHGGAKEEHAEEHRAASGEEAPGVLEASARATEHAGLDRLSRCARHGARNRPRSASPAGRAGDEPVLARRLERDRRRHHAGCQRGSRAGGSGLQRASHRAGRARRRGFHRPRPARAARAQGLRLRRAPRGRRPQGGDDRRRHDGSLLHRGSRLSASPTGAARLWERSSPLRSPSTTSPRGSRSASSSFRAASASRGQPGGACSRASRSRSWRSPPSSSSTRSLRSCP